MVPLDGLNRIDNSVQSLCLEGHLSAPKQMDFQVPQGSIMGPLLFICYINDLPSQCKFTLASVYANDMALLYTGSNPDDVGNNLQLELDILQPGLLKLV